MRMAKQTFTAIIGLLFMVFFCGVLAVAAEQPKEMVDNVFEAMEMAEKSVRTESWAKAEKDVKHMESELVALVKALKLEGEKNYINQVMLLSEGMQESIKEKEDEEFEIPYHATQKFLLQLMGKMDYEKAPVLVVYQRWVEESFEYLEDGNFEGISEEMDEIVNLRKEARAAVEDSEVNSRKLNVFFDMIWDVETAIERENSAGLKETLTKMAKLIESM